MYRTLYKRWILDPSVENKLKYTCYRNTLKSVLQKAERDFYCKKLNSCAGNLCETWKILRSVLNNKTRQCNYTGHFEKDGVVVDSPQSIVDNFNDYFVNVADNLAKDIPASSLPFSSYLGESIMNSFSFTPCNIDEVIQITHGLNNKCSFGYDSIPLNIVKECITQKLFPYHLLLILLFNLVSFLMSSKLQKFVQFLKMVKKIHSVTIDQSQYFQAF